MDSRFIIDDRETPRFRVNRRGMIDPEVFKLEQELIFDKCWLYVGHESELPKKNDFKTRNVGGRPIIFTRKSDGNIGVFINSCTHRGAMLCREKEGNGRFLRCFYHAWSFDTSGNLVAMPDDESYGPNFDRDRLCREFAHIGSAITRGICLRRLGQPGSAFVLGHGSMRRRGFV